MTERHVDIDVVRASRDGHQFHESWAARNALELVPPHTTLTALAIEGFSHEHASDFSSEAHDIADLVRYRGGSTIATARRIEVVQLKYSVAAAYSPMRAAEMAKTMRKFAAVARDLDKLAADGYTIPQASYELVTNRPIDPDTLAAAAALRDGSVVTGRVARHAGALTDAIGLAGEQLRSFAQRLKLIGTGGNLDHLEHGTLCTLASWAGATDSLTHARLSNLQRLVRDRAGGRGQGDNLIGRVDVLGALDVRHERELYPIQAAFPPINAVIERPFMGALLKMVFADHRALLVHAAGGVGKTVLMQVLAKQLAGEHLVLLFDGFGAGMWREPSDGRHLPHKAFPHLANLIAADGLCDLLLPTNHVEDAIAAFREHLDTAVSALRRFRPRASIVLLLDAVDHCGMQAERTQGRSFAHILLESLNIAPIPGVAVVASCRTHRRELAQGQARCREFEVPVFTREETEQLVRGRYPAASQNDITVLQRRSGGNPRYLDNLLHRGPPFDPAGPHEGDGIETLEMLLRRQIDDAQEAAIERGATATEVRGVLAGMALLPPPVPVDELAGALGLAPSVVDGFVADLFPLIEATSTGLIFRDEPTETLIAELIGNDAMARSDLVARLHARQEHSIYAARALPAILVELGAIDELVDLAFDELDDARLSRVALRAVRLARVNAAAAACAAKSRIDDLTRIALEASRISSATERSDQYLRAHPDLVALSGDTEAIRRFRNDHSGWAGERHASLAVLEAFSCDMHGASLEADRALTWMNWLIREQREGRATDRKIAARSEADVVFIKLLAGRDARVDRWLCNLRAPYAFTTSRTMLRMVERLAKADAAGATPARRVVGSIGRCRTRSPPVLAATLSLRSTPETIRRKLLARLADIVPTVDDEPAHYDQRRENGLVDALLGAAGQALGRGMPREAKRIAAHAKVPRSRAYEYDDRWPLSAGIGRHLKSAAIAASTRPRQTRIVDVAPDDMQAAVPLSVRRRGPAAFERRLQRLIEIAKAEPRKGRKPRLGGDEARNWERLMQHRLRILAPFVDKAAAILLAQDPALAIAEAFSAASVAIDKAENYPYRDQARFLTHALFDLLRWTVACRGPLSRASGERIASFLDGSGIQDVSEWIATIELLSGGDETQSFALRLARAAEPLIADDTSIAAQIGNYGALARALLPISVNDARIYFKIGLELADSIGSDDQERIGDLVTFVARYRGEPLALETTHNFVRMCELNFPHEAEGFDWREFGNALAGIAGASALAPISRLADRDKVDLGWTLPALLKALAARARIAPTIAAGLVGLAEFNATWSWFPPELAASILPRLPQSLRESFANDLLIDADRSDDAHLRPETLTGYATLFERELASDSPSLARVRSLQESVARGKKDGGYALSNQATKPLMADMAALTPDTLAQTIEAAAAGYEGHRPTDGFILQSFVAEIADPAPRNRLLTVVLASDTLTFSDKVLFLEEAHDRWRGQSRALDEQLNQGGLTLAQRHMDAVVRSGDFWRRPLLRVARLAGSRRQELVLTVIRALAGQSLDVSSDFWMACAIVLAETASATAMADALTRYTAHGTQALPLTIGDGPWSSSFGTSDDPSELVADLLWMRLGAPAAADRWRAAHALRRLVALRETSVLDRLLTRIGRADAGAFKDRSLPFFELHARLWLLIATARIAKDASAAVAVHDAQLEEIARDDAFPHVLCRHFAIEALRATAILRPAAEQPGRLTWLDTLNRPRLPRIKRQGGRPDFYSLRPEDRPERAPRFYFDYDFDKHQVDPLARVFGLPKWDVEDAAVAWIRRWNSKIESMYDCPRPRWSNEERSWSSGSHPDVDIYGGYLAWHALLLAAGQFAIERPVSGDHWQDRPWESWLSESLLSRADGLWIADGTDLFPVDDRRPITEYTPGEGAAVHVPHHPLKLLHLVGLDGSLRLPPRLIVHGSWGSAEGLDVTIGSQLVRRSEARNVALAVYSADPFFAYLPVEEDEDDSFDRRDEREKLLLTRWLTSGCDRYSKLDEQDPYGFKTALHRVRPSTPIVEQLGLSQADPFGHEWIDPAGRVIFRADAWGTTKGRDRHQTERGGAQLGVELKALNRVLEANDAALLLLIKVRKYLEKTVGDNAFRHQMLGVIVRPGETVETISSVPSRLRTALASFHPRQRGEFADRLRVVEQLGGWRRTPGPRAMFDVRADVTKG